MTLEIILTVEAHPHFVAIDLIDHSEEAPGDQLFFGTRPSNEALFYCHMS